MLMSCQQVASPAEPCQEDSKRKRVEERKMPAVAASVPRTMKVHVRQMEMQMQCAAQERERGKCKSDHETNQIEKFPVHKLSLTYLRRAFWLRLRTQHVQ